MTPCNTHTVENSVQAINVSIDVGEGLPEKVGIHNDRKTVLRLLSFVSERSAATQELRRAHLGVNRPRFDGLAVLPRLHAARAIASSSAGSMSTTAVGANEFVIRSLLERRRGSAPKEGEEGRGRAYGSL